jgi:hypothetical protein
MSQITSSTINATFPIAGQDNNSQGFRDNFAAIASNLNSAATEITDLQTKALLSASLNLTDAGTFTAVPVINNLLGSTISNGQYQELSGTVYAPTISGSTGSIDLTLGAVHNITIGANTTLTFVNWPTYTISGSQVTPYTEVIIVLVGNSSSPFTVTFATTGGSIVKTSSWGSSLSVSNANHYKFKAWTVNGGNTVYLETPIQYAS